MNQTPGIEFVSAYSKAHAKLDEIRDLLIRAREEQLADPNAYTRALELFQVNKKLDDISGFLRR